MKKTVRLLSVILLVAMMMSMMSTGAFAMVNGSGNSGSVVIGGSGSSNGGSVVIGGTPRPSDDSRYAGRNPNEQASSTELETTNKKEYAVAYVGTGDYSDIESSSDVNVQLNEDFLKYVRDNYEDTSKVSAGTLQTALDFFGEELVYGVKEVKVEVTPAPTVAPAAEPTETPAAEPTETPAAEPTETPAAEPTETPAAEPTETPAAEPTETPAAEPTETPAAEPTETPTITKVEDVIIANAADAEILEIPEGLRGGRMLMMAPPKKDDYKTSKFSEVNSNYETLCKALSSSADKIEFTKSFDICNSTDYKITIDLNGKTIVVGSGVNAAFDIMGKTISFTNGFIEGDGFYVHDSGILNLGGYINRKTLDIKVTATENAIYVDDTGVAVIGQGTTLVGPASVDDDAKTPGTVYIAAKGEVRMTGGYVSGGSNYPAVYNNGTLLMNSTAEDLNRSYGVIENDSYIGILAAESGKTTINAGTVVGATGIAITGTHKLNVNGGQITGKGADGAAWATSGAAISVNGYSSTDTSDTNAAAADSVPLVTVSGGALRSEKAAAIKAFGADGKRIASDKRPDITNITLSSEKLITQEKKGEQSDYKVAKFTVNGIGYGTLGEAITAANGMTGDVTIKMGANYKMAADGSDKVAFTNANANIVFDGNGYEIENPTVSEGFLINGGNVTIKNATLYSTATNTTGCGVWVKKGNAYIGGGVTIKKYHEGIYADSGEITVNDVNIADSCAEGLVAKGDSHMVVIMVKDDCDTPIVAAGTDNLEIRGGWFLRKCAKDDDTNTAKIVATYVDPKVSYVQYVKNDGYYEVLFNTTPTVEIVSGETGLYNGVYYVEYDKGDATPIIFNVNPEIDTITAISKTPEKASYNLYTAEGDGKSGNIRIADNDVLMDCPAGAYDLEFKFKNGYVISGKLNLFVYPKVAAMFNVPNYDGSNGVNIADIYAGNAEAGKMLEKYLNSDYALGNHNAADDWNIAIVMSELPDKIGIGSDPDGEDVIYLENYIKGNATANSTGYKSYTTVPYGKYAGNYVYFLSYADINNLASGQNYAFLYYDLDDGAVERLPFIFKNNAVSINPTSLDWGSIDGYAYFTVKPDVLDNDSVYIDGEKVDSAYWTYNTKTNVLAIKESYLNAMKHKEHTLEVITSRGKVGATIDTGVALKPKGVNYHVYGGGKALSFIGSDIIKKDGGVWIGSTNPTRLDPSAYTWDGDNGFTLSAAFLNKLSYGTYYISAYVFNGEEYEYKTTTFRVISASEAAYTPATGDNSNIIMWIAILVLSAVIILVILLPRLKKSKVKENSDPAIRK